MPDNNKLTTTETSKLLRLEQTITTTRGAFVACGKALAEICDQRLYRQKYSTFEEYCKERWGWGSKYAFRLIEAAKVKEDIERKSLEINPGVSPIGDKVTNEAQARALAAVPEESRTKVLKAALKAGDVTAKGIAKAAAQLEKNNEKEIIDLDKTGYPVPPKAKEYWDRASEPEEILRLISKARNLVKDLQGTEDILYAEVNMNGIYSYLSNAHREFRNSVPYAVCPICQGQAPKTCVLCHGRGVVSKFLFDTAIPEEVKTIRAKSIKAA